MTSPVPGQLPSAIVMVFADSGFGPGFLPGFAVVAVAGQVRAGHDDQAGVGVDDDLVIGGVRIVLRLRCDGVVAGGHRCRL